MTILVFGKTGQVGIELAALGGDVISLGREEADLSDPAACAAHIARLKPAAVINAAAYTAVDRAEEDTGLAQTINGDAPAEMAAAAAKIGVPFVHISTDYVFDGSGDKPWSVDQAIAPLGVYGRTKAAGEAGVRSAGGPHAILRTSWVFSAHGANFLKTMLRLGADRDALSIVDDQIGGPTPAGAIAKACMHMAHALKQNPDLSGTYHFSGAPDVSWADFAEAIFEQAGLQVDVARIPSSDYPTPAERPKNSRLDCESLRAAFGIERPDWRGVLPDMIAALRK